MKYSAAVTSVRAGLSRLLSWEIWEKLLSASSLDKIVTLLDDTQYQTVISKESFDLESCENQLQRYYAENARIAFTFLSGQALKLVSWYWEQFDLENLITLIWGITNSVSPDERRKSLIPLEKLSDFDWEKWADLDSLDALTDWLEKNLLVSTMPRPSGTPGMNMSASNAHSFWKLHFIKHTSVDYAHILKICRQKIENMRNTSSDT